MESVLDPATALARLAVAVIIADGRVTAAEIATARVLDELGFGPMRERLLAELERAQAGAIELEPAIGALSNLSPRARAVIFEILAELAAADGELSPTEAALLDRLATRWDLEPPRSTGRSVALEGASRSQTEQGRGVRVPIETPESEAKSHAAGNEERTAAPATAGDGLPPELLRALALLGLPPDASAQAVDEAFRALVHRYDPAHVIDLGPEFAVLAIRRLSQIADAYVTWKRLEQAR